MYIKREVIKSSILQAGSDSSVVFGGQEIENGLHLQQDATEFAELIFYLMTRIGSSKLSIDIGIASGGQTKILRDYFNCEKTIIVDNGTHPKFKHWERIKPLVKSEIILEIIDNSHSENVKNKLKEFKGLIDFAFIDGDHTYKGLKEDIELIKSIAKQGCIFILHDTKMVEDCNKVHNELFNNSEFTLLKNIDIKFGISIWKYL